MTIRFQIQREDALAFNRACCTASPTFRRTQTKIRLIIPVMTIAFWGFATSRSGFDWGATVIYLGIAIFWFLFYPIRYRKYLDKYLSKIVDEGSYRKNFGNFQLTLLDEGLKSISPTGQSICSWSSVDRTQLTDTHLFIFMNGFTGFPVPLRDVDREVASSALEYINQKIISNPTIP